MRRNAAQGPPLASSPADEAPFHALQLLQTLTELLPEWLPPSLFKHPSCTLAPPRPVFQVPICGNGTDGISDQGSKQFRSKRTHVRSSVCRSYQNSDSSLYRGSSSIPTA